MKLTIVFGIVTIVALFQFVYADVKPLTLTEIEDKSNLQPSQKESSADEKLRLPRTHHKKHYYGGGYGGGNYCNVCGGQHGGGGHGGYPVGGGYGGYPVGGASGSWSQSSAQSSSGSFGFGKK